MSNQPGIRAAILVATAVCEDPLGITIQGLCVATDWSNVQISAAASELRKAAKLFSTDHHYESRYFTSAALRDAAIPGVTAYVQALRAAGVERRRITRLDRQRERRAAERAPRPVKPQKLTAPSAFKAPSQPRPVNRAPDARKRWADMEPIYPVNPDGSPADRVTIAPAPPERLYRTNTHSR